MTRAFRALTAEPWAIEPSWLPLLAAIAQRDGGSPHVQERGDWVRRDFELMAGPGAQKLPGSSRSFIVDGVAVIPVTGPIFPRANMMTEQSGATSITTLQADYRAALASPDAGAVMLLVDSPGGAVSGINSFADMVAAGTKKKTTCAHVTGTCASAAYWIASAASQVTVERTGIVGSIGVVAALAKQVAPDREGMIDVEVVSSNAPLKRVDPTTEDGSGEVRKTLDAIEASFIADVARGRGVPVAKVRSDFGQGGVKVGTDAVAAGMADRVQSYEAALSALQRTVRTARRMDALRQ